MDFIILKMEEDSKVPLILERPFLHTADAVIRVEQKQLNLGIKKSLDEPPTDLELKPLPDHLEYAFLEEPSFLPVIISSQLSEQNKNNLEYAFLEEPSFLPVIISSQLSEQNQNKLVIVLKKHKQAFAWKTQTFLLIALGCMLAIFHDMIEESVEVFMDEFSVFGNSFDNCLYNLDKMLQRCKNANLVLNWKKCHFMVKEGIVLGHKVSGAGLEVDKAKIDVISKLPPPLMLKNKRQKGTEHVAADHLSRIKNDETSEDSEVNDNFPRKTLMEITTRDLPRFTDFANYLVEGIKHQTSTARTPEQNGVVERRNRTLVEAARTVLSAAKVPLFFWSEAIATACFTQKRLLVIPQHEKTPYHIINGKKPSVKFFHIFGSLCYIVRDGENIDKMKAKGDACIFVGYSTQSRAYQVYNKRIRVTVITIHVNFDGLPHMASDHVGSDPVPQSETVTMSNELDLLFSPMFDELLNGTTLVVSKSSTITTADAHNQRQ
ncbi:retrovirus-related pol polyprotein from transposon TNT 1-94 [Tanacetum coccineum]